jgi:hypothetical protein
VNQQCSQVGVPALADAQQTLPLAAGMLPRYETEPRGEVTSVLEASRIADRCSDGTGRDDTDPSHGAQTLTNLIFPRAAIDASVVGLNALIEFVQTPSLVSNDFSGQGSQFIICIFEDVGQFGSEGSNTHWQEDAIFAQQPSGLVDQRGTLAKQPHADAMQRLNVLLCNRFRRNKAHIRSRDCPADGLGVVVVVLVGSDVGLYELWTYLANIVTQIAKAARPVVRAAADLDADQTRREIGETLDQLLACETFREDRSTVRISTVKLKDALGQINSNRRGIHIGSSRICDGYQPNHRGARRRHLEGERVHSIC